MARRHSGCATRPATARRVLRLLLPPADFLNILRELRGPRHFWHLLSAPRTRDLQADGCHTSERKSVLQPEEQTSLAPSVIRLDAAHNLLDREPAATLIRVNDIMRPLRVAMVAESYFPTLGGIQEHVRNMRNLLCRQGVEVSILTGSPAVPSVCGPEDAERGVIRIGRARGFRTGGTFTQATIGPMAAWNFRRALREGQFDVLNIHGPCDFGLAFFALAMFRGPKVLTLHNAYFPDAPWRHRGSAILSMGLSVEPPR